MAVEDIENDKDQEFLETDSRPKILDLPRTEDEWHAIFDFLSDVIMVLDKDGRILKANKAALEYLDLPLERIIGNFCFKIIHGTDGPVAGCPTMRMLESHQYEEADLYLESKGFCARVMTYPLWPDKGDEVQFIHVIRNIDSHIRIEEVLRKRVKELDCLYEISRLIESKSSSVESILEEIPN
jgi:PAS domain S-box-containing protein